MKAKYNKARGLYTSRLFLFYGLFIAAWAGTTGVWWTVGLSFPFIVASHLWTIRYK